MANATIEPYRRVGHIQVRRGAVPFVRAAYRPITHQPLLLNSLAVADNIDASFWGFQRVSEKIYYVTRSRIVYETDLKRFGLSILPYFDPVLRHGDTSEPVIFTKVSKIEYLFT